MSEYLPTSAPPATTDPLLGTVLGGAYRITRLLGVGGMGHVYEAEHVRLPKRFAIKIVRSELARDEASFERFKREAEIASSLGNRHIVQVIDFNVLPDGAPYMVMEFLTGEDLATRLARVGRLSPQVAIPLLAQVVSALEAAHSKGIVHRDIKPENIFLAQVDGEDDFVKLLDFGLSKIRGAQKRLTANLSVLGTPWYMSPEQARGDADLDHRTDVYALAVVLYQTLTGRVPFEGENVYAVLTQIATQPPPPLRRQAPEVSERLEQVVLGALAKDPAERPASVRALWDAVQWAAEITTFRPSDPGVWAPPPLESLQPERVRELSNKPVAMGQLPTLEPVGGGALARPNPAPPRPSPTDTVISDAPHLRPTLPPDVLPVRAPWRLAASAAGVTLVVGGLLLCGYLVARPRPISPQAVLPAPAPAPIVQAPAPAPAVITALAPTPSPVALPPPHPVIAAPPVEASVHAPQRRVQKPARRVAKSRSDELFKDSDF